ncbi:Nif11-like leader peptide family RiPP precursor [Bradyrhizobium sp. WSM1743]|uniref:Nif11-like leader peptide family RiPP precursor n=1 Tax=Bradyrhizobium sp. WSM1743 TaxID=318996 RepID=UPI000406C74E|nr:Nif11-like leader peptide family RiPP precursor [Bradyrhizobium sp. WSM1743]
MKIDQWTNFVSSVGDDSASLTILRSGDTQRIIALAKSKGFDFTEEDIADLSAGDRSGSLSDEALDAASGAYAGLRI